MVQHPARFSIAPRIAFRLVTKAPAIHAGRQSLVAVGAQHAIEIVGPVVRARAAPSANVGPDDADPALPTTSGSRIASPPSVMSMGKSEASDIFPKSPRGRPLILERSLSGVPCNVARTSPTSSASAGVASSATRPRESCHSYMSKGLDVSKTAVPCRRGTPEAFDNGGQDRQQQSPDPTGHRCSPPPRRIRDRTRGTSIETVRFLSPRLGEDGDLVS